MDKGNIYQGPNMPDLWLALFFPRGRSLTFGYKDENEGLHTAHVYVNEVNNLTGNGTFGITGFLCGSDGKYSATYNPMTGEGTFMVGV